MDRRVQASFVKTATAAPLPSGGPVFFGHPSNQPLLVHASSAAVAAVALVFLAFRSVSQKVIPLYAINREQRGRGEERRGEEEARKTEMGGNMSVK